MKHSSFTLLLAPKPKKTRYDRSGEPTSDRYSENKDGNMNKWGRDKIKREGPSPKNRVPKKDKTQVLGR